MQRVVQNILVVLLLSASILTMVYIADANYMGDLLAPIWVWIIPPVIGALASIGLHGRLWVRALYCALIFPIALITYRGLLMEPPRDAGSDAFLFVFVVGLAIYSILGLVIAFFAIQTFSQNRNANATD